MGRIGGGREVLWGCSMPRTIAVIALFLISSSTIPAFALSNFDLAVFGGPSFKLNSSFSDKDWGDGWLAGVGVSYFLNEHGAIGIELSYHHFPFQGDVMICPWPWDPPHVSVVEGDPSSIYELATSLRIIDRRWPLDSYIQFGIGLDRIQAGDAPDRYIFYASGNRLAPGELKTVPFFSLGIGFGIDLRPNLSFTLEGQFTNSFDNRDFRIPAKAGLRYRL